MSESPDGRYPNVEVWRAAMYPALQPPQPVAADGQTQTVAEVNGRTVTIIGPSEIEVGTSATFVADLPSDVAGSWVYPDGTLADVGQGVTYTADSSGSFPVTMVIAVPRGDPQLIIHRVEALE